MASHEETKSMLRRILYITIFLFAIFGLTSIGILVDAARKDQPVTLVAALVLLSILLAFLVIFVIIICFWRRANQRQRWRLERDEESRYIRGENCQRYLRNSTELKELKRLEKKGRKQRDRQREIQNAIAAAKGRIEGRKISPPRDPRYLTTGQPMHRASGVFVPTPDPIFGHGTHGLFGARPAMGGGLNPNFGLSPPTSPRSPRRETPREAEQRRREMKTAPVEETPEVKNGGEGGKEASATPANPKPAALDLSSTRTSPHKITRKEVGTPPKGDRGALAGPNGLRVVNGTADTAEDSGNGVVVGIAGERVDGLRSHQVPSGIFGHGLIAIPPLAKAKTVPVTETGRWSMEREESRRANGWKPPSEKWYMNMVTGGKRADLRNSDESKKSWKDMSADEIEAEIRKEKDKNERAATNGEKKGATRIPTPKRDKQRDAKRAAHKSERERRIAKSEKQKMQARFNEERAKVAAAATRVREEDEREVGEWIMRQTEEVQCYLKDVAGLLPKPKLRRRKSSETYPMPHLSAVPHRLKPQHAQQKSKDEAKKPAKPTLDLSASSYDKRSNVEIIHSPPDTSSSLVVQAPATSSYDPYIAYKPPAQKKTYQSPRVEELTTDTEEESEWQAGRREQEQARQREEEAARLALIAAFKPPSPLRPRSTTYPPPSPLQRPVSPTGTFSDWHTLYKQGAKERGVTGFTCSTSTTEVGRNEAFDTFSEVMREREKNARIKEGQVGVARTFSQMRGVERHRLTVPEILNPIDEARHKEGGVLDYYTAKEAQAALAQLEKLDIGDRNALDTWPSQQNLAKYETADAAQAAISKLPVVSLHSTERGTTLSSFQVPASTSSPAKSTPAKKGKSGIPRLGAPAAKAGTPTTANKSAIKPLPGQFGYNNARKGKLDLTPNKGGSPTAGGAGAWQKGEGKKTSLPKSEHI